MDVNKRIKIIRKDKKMTQEKFADFLGISFSHLSKIETNKSELQERIKFIICIKCGVNIKWLETGEGEKYSDTIIPTEDQKELLSYSEDELFQKFLALYKKLKEATSKKEQEQIGKFIVHIIDWLEFVGSTETRQKKNFI